MKLSALTLVNLAAASVLLLTPFLIGLTASAPYDPWYDLDENGKIDIFDVVRIAGTYGTTGDPGKNVTVTNWPTNTLAYTVSTNIPGYGSISSPWIPVNGYSKISICIASPIMDNYYRLEARHSEGFAFIVETLNHFAPDLIKTYDVPNEEIRVIFGNNEPGDTPLELDIYLIR
jgi:hypothetical protein